MVMFHRSKGVCGNVGGGRRLNTVPAPPVPPVVVPYKVPFAPLITLAVGVVPSYVPPDPPVKSYRGAKTQPEPLCAILKTVPQPEAQLCLSPPFEAVPYR